jgi:flavin-binding protein dodecin
MGEDTFEGHAHARTVVVGTSEVSFDDALKAAVAKAVDAEIAGIGDELVLLRQSVTISNPKIGEYKVEVGTGI